MPAYALPRFALVSLGCNVTTTGDGVQVQFNVGHGPETSEARSTSDFTGVVTASSVDVHVTVADGPRRVEVQLPDLAHLGSSGRGDVRADVGGRDLTVVGTGSGDFNLAGAGALDVTLEGSGDLKARGVRGLVVVASGSAKVDADDVNGEVRLTLSGTGDADVDGRVTALDASSRGSGDIEVSGIAGGPVSLRLQGTGKGELAGAAPRAELIALGSGRIDARDLVLTDATVRLGGTGDIRVHATGVVDGTLTGNGDVQIKGGARSDVKDDGLGEVETD